MRKPTICICENKGADQRLCFRYTDSTIFLRVVIKRQLVAKLTVSSYFLAASNASVSIKIYKNTKKLTASNGSQASCRNS